MKLLETWETTTTVNTFVDDIFLTNKKFILLSKNVNERSYNNVQLKYGKRWGRRQSLS